MDLQDDNVLRSSIFDCVVLEVDGRLRACFGIQSYSSNKRFKSTVFITRRPIEHFKDFCELMSSRHPNIIVPPLPFEEVLRNEHPDIVNEKIAQLSDFCQQLVEIPEIFNDDCLPLFYQTNMSMEDIRRRMTQQEAEVVDNSKDGQQVGADNSKDGQQVGADSSNNNRQVLENRDNSSDGEFSAIGNASESETDEPIFRMDDI